MAEFNNTHDIVKHILKIKGGKHILIYGLNGVGKTKLSRSFAKKLNNENEVKVLYYNSYTEDLFTWEENKESEENADIKLKLKQSRFFKNLSQGIATEDSIKRFLNSFITLDFKIDINNYEVSFFDASKNTIKISRGEETLFKWCLFLAIIELALLDNEAYKNVEYIYIDDPVSSLDDSHIMSIAHTLATQFIKKNNKKDKKIKFIISTHHSVFNHVLLTDNSFKKSSYILERPKYHNQQNQNHKKYIFKETKNSNGFNAWHHLFLIDILIDAINNDKLYAYHFQLLRNILETVAIFFGRTDWSCIIKDMYKTSDEGYIARVINIFNHSSYSLYTKKELVDDNKEIIKDIVNYFLKKYNFEDHNKKLSNSDGI